MQRALSMSSGGWGSAAHCGADADAHRVDCDRARRDAHASEAKAEGGHRVLEEVGVGREEGGRRDGDSLAHHLAHDKFPSVLQIDAYYMVCMHGWEGQCIAAGVGMLLQLISGKETPTDIE